MTSLNICSYNVHNFIDKKGEANLERVAELLKPLELDVLLLQEASHPTYQRTRNIPDPNNDENEGIEHTDLAVLARSLGMRYFRFGSERAGSGMGQAILSKHKILSSAAYAVGGHRCVFGATVRIDDEFDLKFYNCHLDHRSEDKRLLQLEKVFASIQLDEEADAKTATEQAAESTTSTTLSTTTNKKQITVLKGHILVGDFNSISSPDHYVRNGKPC